MFDSSVVVIAIRSTNTNPPDLDIFIHTMLNMLDLLGQLIKKQGNILVLPGGYVAFREAIALPVHKTKSGIGAANIYSQRNFLHIN